MTEKVDKPASAASKDNGASGRNGTDKTVVPPAKTDAGKTRRRAAKRPPASTEKRAKAAPRRRKKTAGDGRDTPAGRAATIYLPALKPAKTAKRSGAAKKTSRKAAQQDTNSDTARREAVSPTPVAEPRTDDLLPEYRSTTNGLRELLASIDPQERFEPSPADFADTPLVPVPEEAMHIPHSRPGIPGSPDLPIGPTRWGRNIINALALIVVAFIGGLAYSHFSSPTGIDWQKLRTAAVDIGNWSRQLWQNEPGTQSAPSPAAAPRAMAKTDHAPAAQPSGETRVDTLPRLSTTAATARPETRSLPSDAELSLTPAELEARIRAIESLDAPSAGRQATKTATTEPPAEEAPVAPPARAIDPALEQQMFARASSYLKQRDIASARMILQYAASLGSGISAMALAETFDPFVQSTTPLAETGDDPTEARKWYRTAESLGVKEAGDRLARLK